MCRVTMSTSLGELTVSMDTGIFHSVWEAKWSAEQTTTDTD